MEFKHTTPLKLRFVDMDAFGHLNNANYLTYLEEARIKYVDEVVSWKYGWSEKGIIMARAEVDFLVPGHFKDDVSILTRCSHIGNKSFTLEYRMIKSENSVETILATATTIVVMYDYVNKVSIPVLEEWKSAIIKFEGL